MLGEVVIIGWVEERLDSTLPHPQKIVNNGLLLQIVISEDSINGI